VSIISLFIEGIIVSKISGRIFESVQQFSKAKYMTVYLFLYLIFARV